MKIIQVATVITPDNAYGGPTTVALNQCRALRDAGHEVVLAAGARGFDGDPPSTFQGVDVKLFPATQLLPGAGFAGVAAPGMLTWLVREARAHDAAQVHLARDFVTLPAAALLQNLGLPVCVQPHGMIDPSDKMLAKPLDLALTRRVLRAARRVFYLTSLERDGLEEVADSSLRLEELHNGFDVASMPPPSDHEHITVLYLGRLHERKRPLAFVEAAVQIAGDFPDVYFRLVGPDEGQGAAVQELIESSGLGERLRWDGPADRSGCQRAMASADLYVLPSIAETYPMSVLEAMAAGLPVIVTDTNGLAPAVARGGAGVVTGGAPEQIAQVMAGLLLDPSRMLAMGIRGRDLVEAEFSMKPIAEQLARAYADARG